MATDQLRAQDLSHTHAANNSSPAESESSTAAAGASRVSPAGGEEIIPARCVVCNAESFENGGLLRKCSACKDPLGPFYCSRAHQAEDWKNHKLICAGRKNGTEASKAPAVSSKILSSGSSPGPLSAPRMRKFGSTEADEGPHASLRRPCVNDCPPDCGCDSLPHSWRFAHFNKLSPPQRERARSSTDEVAAGTLMIDNGQLAAAVAHAEATLRKDEAVFGKGTFGTAWALKLMAHALYKIDRCDDAFPFCLRALNLVEDAFGPESLKMAELLFIFVTINNHLKRHQDALSYAERARAIHEKIEGPDSDFCLSMVASCYRGLGDYKRALGLHKRCLAYLLRDTGKSGSPERTTHIAGCFIDMGTCTKDDGDAAKLFLQAMRTMERGGLPDHPEMAFAAVEYARALTSRIAVRDDVAPEILKHARRGAGLALTIFGEENFTYYTGTKMQGMALFALKRYSEALEVLDTCLRLDREGIGHDPPNDELTTAQWHRWCKGHSDQERRGGDTRS